MKKDLAQNQKWMEEFQGYMEEEGKESLPIIEEEKSENSNGESFAKVFEDFQKQHEVSEGSVVSGKVINIGDEYVTIDIGFKCEGMIPLHEFKDATGVANVKMDEVMSVYVERLELENGFMLLSKDRADIIKAWDEISSACESDQIVEGTVISKVKGGLSVDIGVKAFLPGSQLDLKPIKNLDVFVGQKLKFKIIKFNKKRGNIVLSRRAVISHERDMQRANTLAQLQEGALVTGSVKNITEYGAFIDLGGMDGLLHITDMSWGRIKHPSELFSVGDDIKVKVLKFDREKERVSLGLKQASPNPWEEVEYKFPIGIKVKGKIVSLKEYGAFVELSEGVEGLIHISEMSWTERVKHPSKLLKVGEEVECKVLEVDTTNKRISLGLKQLTANPWDELESKYPVGGIIEEAVIKSVTDFGVFVDVGLGIDGLIHISDISWIKKFNHPSEKYKKGEKIRVVVLGIDKKQEKFSLGIKQLERDPWENIKSRYRVNQTIEGKITKLTDFGAFVELEEGIEGLVYISEISEKRVTKPSDILNVDEVVKAEIISIEPKERRIGLSIKALSRTREREDYESYNAEKSSRASFGDVFGDTLRSVFGSKKKEDADGQDDGPVEEDMGAAGFEKESANDYMDAAIDAEFNESTDDDQDTDAVNDDPAAPQDDFEAEKND